MSQVHLRITKTQYNGDRRLTYGRIITRSCDSSRLAFFGNNIAFNTGNDLQNTAAGLKQLPLVCVMANYSSAKAVTCGYRYTTPLHPPHVGIARVTYSSYRSGGLLLCVECLSWSCCGGVGRFASDAVGESSAEDAGCICDSSLDSNDE